MTEPPNNAGQPARELIAPVPCHWCGGKVLISIRGHACFVMCEVCDAAGPSINTGDIRADAGAAITRWNALTKPPRGRR